MKCATPGCGRAIYRGTWCDRCYRRELKSRQPAKVVVASTWETGMTRRLDGQDERQMTDGSMTWWVTKT